MQTEEFVLPPQFECGATGTTGLAPTFQVQRPLFDDNAPDQDHDAMPFLALEARVAGERSCVPLPPGVDESCLLIDAALQSMAVTEGPVQEPGPKSKRTLTQLRPRKVSGYKLKVPDGAAFFRPESLSTAVSVSMPQQQPEAASEPEHQGSQEQGEGDTDMADGSDAYPRLEDLQIQTCFSSPALDPVLQDSASRALNKRRRAASYPPAKPYRLAARMVLFRNDKTNGQWQETLLSPPARRPCDPLPHVAEQPDAENEQDDTLTSGTDEQNRQLASESGEAVSRTSTAAVGEVIVASAESETDHAGASAAARPTPNEAEAVKVEPGQPRSSKKKIVMSIDMTDSDDAPLERSSSALCIASLLNKTEKHGGIKIFSMAPPLREAVRQASVPARAPQSADHDFKDEEMEDLPPPPPKMSFRAAGGPTSPNAGQEPPSTSASGPVRTGGAQDDHADEETPPPPRITRPFSMLRPMVFVTPRARISTASRSVEAEGAPGAPQMGPTGRPHAYSALTRSPSPSERIRRPVEALSQPLDSSPQVTDDETPAKRARLEARATAPLSARASVIAVRHSFTSVRLTAAPLAVSRRRGRSPARGIARLAKSASRRRAS